MTSVQKAKIKLKEITVLSIFHNDAENEVVNEI